MTDTTDNGNTIEFLLTLDDVQVGIACWEFIHRNGWVAPEPTTATLQRLGAQLRHDHQVAAAILADADLARFVRLRLVAKANGFSLADTYLAFKHGKNYTWDEVCQARAWRARHDAAMRCSLCGGTGRATLVELEPEVHNKDVACPLCANGTPILDYQT